MAILIHVISRAKSVHLMGPFVPNSQFGHSSAISVQHLVIQSSLGFRVSSCKFKIWFLLCFLENLSITLDKIRWLLFCLDFQLGFKTIKKYFSSFLWAPAFYQHESIVLEEFYWHLRQIQGVPHLCGFH